MNVTTTKQGFRPFVTVVFLFGALLFGVVRANAQATPPDDNLNWKTVPEAMLILDGQIGQLDGEIAGLTPGTPAYEDVENHLSYYKLIYGALEDGVSVPDAVTNSLSGLYLTKTDDDPQGQATFNQLMGDAIGLLTN